MGGVVRSSFRMHPPTLSLRTRLGCGNPVGVVLRDASTIRWLPYASGWIAMSGLCPSSQ